MIIIIINTSGKSSLESKLQESGEEVRKGDEVRDQHFTTILLVPLSLSSPVWSAVQQRLLQNSRQRWYASGCFRSLLCYACFLFFLILHPLHCVSCQLLQLSIHFCNYFLVLAYILSLNLTLFPPPVLPCLL